MTSPSDGDIQDLDKYIMALAKLGDNFTLDDFRTAQMAEARRAAVAVRGTLYVAGLLFMLTALANFGLYDKFGPDGMLWTGLWAISLGGLGAVSSLFLRVLKFVPQDSLHASDEFEAIGRIFLGCLFSYVIAFTMMPETLHSFFLYCGGKCTLGTENCPPSGPKLLLPFLCGYSIPLVLGLLEKVIRAVELTVGLEDPRQGDPRRNVKRR